MACNPVIAVYFPGSENRYNGKGRADRPRTKFNDGYIRLDTETRKGSDPVTISQYLDDDNQEFYGFDGCPSLLFAKVEPPVTAMITRLRDKVAKDSGMEKITLVVTAHSRGCMSAFLLAKKINEDPQLRDKVELVLDMHDPVPGNLKTTAIFDMFGSTITKQVGDLSACKCIRKASVTVNINAGPVGVSALIPKFHKDTEVEVDFIPGNHFAQMRPASRMTRAWQPDGSANQHLSMFFLALLKSLQLSSENGIQLKAYRNVLEHFQTLMRDSRDERLLRAASGAPAESIQASMEFSLKAYDEIERLFTTVLSLEGGEAEITKKQFELLLYQAQCCLYEGLLGDQKKRSTEPRASRGLHGGGNHQAITPKDSATHFNNRHAAMDRRLETSSLYGYHDGKRPMDLYRPGVRQMPPSDAREVFLTPDGTTATYSSSSSSSSSSCSSSSSSSSCSSSSSAPAWSSSGIAPASASKQVHSRITLKATPFLHDPNIVPIPKKSGFFSFSPSSSEDAMLELTAPTESGRLRDLKERVQEAINATHAQRSGREGFMTGAKSNMRLSHLVSKELKTILDDADTNSNQKLEALIQVMEVYSRRGGRLLKGTTGQFCVNLLGMLTARNDINSGTFLDNLQAYKDRNQQLMQTTLQLG